MLSRVRAFAQRCVHDKHTHHCMWASTSTGASASSATYTAACHAAAGHIACGRPHAAIHVLTQSLVTPHPAHQEASLRLNLAAALQACGRLSDASVQLHAACSACPDSKQAHAALACIHLLEHKHAQALDAFVRALVIDPSYARATVGLLTCLSHYMRAVVSKYPDTREEAVRRLKYALAPLLESTRTPAAAALALRLQGILQVVCGGGGVASVAEQLESKRQEMTLAAARLESHEEQFFEQLRACAAAVALESKVLQDRASTTDGLDFNYGQQLAPRVADITDAVSTDARGPPVANVDLNLHDTPSLSYVKEGEELAGVVVETNKMMACLASPESGVITELSLPADAQPARMSGTTPVTPSGNVVVGRIIPAVLRPQVIEGAQRGGVTHSAARDLKVADVVDMLKTVNLNSAGSGRVAILTGAGMSSASGLRTRKELWSSMSREEHVGVWRVSRGPTPWGALWSLVHTLSSQPPALAGPNAAHLALAHMQHAGLVSSVTVTQNVDDLHQEAARRVEAHAASVVELHGTLESCHCDTCAQVYGPARSFLPSLLEAARASGHSELELRAPSCTAAGCGGSLRPSVVLFGELVPATVLSAAVEQASLCDIMLVIGTSADVSPAADLPRFAARMGARVIEIKRTPSLLSHKVSYGRVAAPAEVVLPELARALLEGR